MVLPVTVVRPDDVRGLASYGSARKTPHFVSVGRTTEGGGLLMTRSSCFCPIGTDTTAERRWIA
jgi:hypothetical protein